MSDSQAFLTQLRYNTTSSDVQRDLRSPRNMHRTLMRLIPDALSDTPRADSGLLYRLTPGAPPHALILTHLQPQLDNLPDGYTLHAVTKNITDTYRNLTAGTRVRFAVDANLIRSEPRPGQRGQKISITSENGAADWWHNRQHRLGLTTTSLTITKQPLLRVLRDDKPDARMPVMRITGTATINNPEHLRHTLLHGIGKGKSWGLGLLTIAAAR